ncbi:hypothetical protein C8R47DRAFT_1125428 [Mycena vitilis]|nr:hypothetical protein C8R47DRAFT_1125428 [Mycena vitilis]
MYPDGSRIDILRLVLLHCSLVDLCRLRPLSRWTRRAVDTGPVWSAARKRLDQMPPPPIVKASGSWTEPGYARMVFGPGKCTVCTLFTHNLPACFALGVRFCSQICREAFGSKDEFILLPHWRTMAAHTTGSFGGIPGLLDLLPSEYLDAEKLVPSALQSSTEELRQSELVDGAGALPPRPKFVVRTTAQLAEEWGRRYQSWEILKLNGQALAEWAVRYENDNGWAYEDGMILTPCDIKNTNLKRVADFARKHRLHLRQALRAPTMRKIVHAFNRDKTLIDTKSMSAILADVRFDILYDETHTCQKPEYFGLVFVPDIKCPGCSEEFFSGDVGGFEDHRSAIHPGVAYAFRCQYCPSNMPLIPEFKYFVQHLGRKHLLQFK